MVKDNSILDLPVQTRKFYYIFFTLFVVM